MVTDADRGVPRHRAGIAGGVARRLPKRQELAAFAAADATHVDAMCVSDGAMGSIGGQLRGSTDGGENWRNAGTPELFPSGVTAISDNGAGTLIVAASSGDSKILRTQNDGGSFRTVEDVAGGEWTDAGFTTRTQAFAVLRLDAMYLSRDDAATWHRVRF